MVSALKSLLVLSGLLCLALGYEPGYQFVYNYHGRSVVGMNELKLQNAIVELQGKVLVQSTDDKTLYVKLNEWRLKRNGSWLKSPFFSYGEDSTPEEIEGIEETLPKQEILSTPFVITHNKGSIISVKIGSDEPNWIVNFKKSIASHLQLDITGVRSEFAHRDVPSKEFNSAHTTFENGVTGDCATIIQVNRLPSHQAIQTESFDFSIFERVCKDVPVYEIIKTKDFNRCINNPTLHSVTQPSYTCTLGRGQCANSMQRTATYKYIGCGPSFDKLNVVHIHGYGDLMVKPFAIQKEKIDSYSLTSFVLEKKEAISSMLTAPSSPKELYTLSYTYEVENPDNTRKYPDLTTPWYKISVPTSTILKNVVEVLRLVAKDLVSKPDSEKDNIERLTTVSYALPYLSLEELRSLWKQVKDQEDIIVDLFIDTLVKSGSNPALMLVKELVESEEIKGARSVWAVGAIGHSAKTPTRELLHELISMIKSRPVQESKTLKQTAYLSLAGLISAACDSPFYKEKRFPVEYLGDFCNSKDPVVLQEFLPMLAEELKLSETKSTSEHLAALTALGALGIEEILPILEPHIRGTEKYDDTAERTRAIFSLHRVMFSYPEKVLPWVVPIADNVAERPEVRMAAIAMVFTVNAPFAAWQKLASRTWFEPSVQVQSFIYNYLYSLSKSPVYSPMHMEMVNKARSALALVKPAPFGLPYSSSFMHTSYVREGLGVLAHLPMWRMADEMLPVAFGTRLAVHLGPFVTTPLEINGWNYNMEDTWTSLFSRLVSKKNVKTTVDDLKQIWDEIKPTRRPSDKPAGFIQVKLAGALNRVFDLLQLEKEVPSFINELMAYQNKPYPVSFLKYRILSELQMRVPSEMGLPVHLMMSNPLLASIQGQISADLKSGSVNFNLASEIGWKFTTEVRVELPWSGNYIASGVDVRANVRLPRETSLKFSRMYSMLNWTWIPSDKSVDLIYYHVKPYTITRNIADVAVPTLEDKSVKIISVKEEPFKRDMPLAERLGVDIRLQTRSELDHFDMASWLAWFQNFDLSTITTMPVPLTPRHREYRIRYQPEATKAKSIESWFHYSYYWKNSDRSATYETGTSKPIPPSSQIQSWNPMTVELTKHISERVLKDIEGGKTNIFMGGIKSQLSDGSYYLLNASFAFAEDDMYTKDVRDLRVERSLVQPSRPRQMEYVLCGVTNRIWNKPTAFGFTPEVLYMTEDSRYTFGRTECNEAKVIFKAKVYRNETAAKFARESTVGRRCQEHLSRGLLDSPACNEAREYDHTYNVYELSADYENLPVWSTPYLQRAKYLLQSIVSPFVVDHRFETQNPSNRISWTIKRNPVTGDADLTVVRPTETIEARNIRGKYIHFSPLLSSYWKIFFPLRANRNYVELAYDLSTANVTEAKCYVGPKSIYTFDGPSYNYTFDGCDHVLVTDSWKNHNFAVLSREVEGRKIVTVIYEKDRIEIDPSGSVTINGAKKPLTSRIQIQDGQRLIAEIYSFPNGAKFYLHPVSFFMKIQGSHITLNAPLSLRGRTTGLCGDYNQETSGEWRTADRCVLSSGKLMAASFRLKSGESCSALPAELSQALKRETDNCQSVDEKVRTYLTPVDLEKPSRCISYEPLIIKMGENGKTTCTSTTPAVRCNPGCKPTYVNPRGFTFKCQGGDFHDFHTQFTVPVACTTY